MNAMVRLVVLRAALAAPFLLAMSGAFADEPQWLKDARAREGKDLKEQSIKSKDGFFTARTLGKLQNDVEVDENSYAMTLDIGSETPMNCEVIVDGFDLAGIVRATADITFQQLGEVQGKIEQRAMERTDAGAFGSSPYLALDWLYRVNDGKNVALGGVKQIAIVKDGRGLYCAHVDIGYAKSFFDAARMLAETIRFSSSEAAPYYSEIAVASLGPDRIGIVASNAVKDEDGDSKLVSTTSLLLRITPESLQAQDTFHVQWIAADGSLINASQIVVSNGEIDANLQLTSPETENEWLVKGEIKGKPIEEKIVGDAPASWLEMAQLRRGMFGQDGIVGKTFKEKQWTAIDPTQFVESQTKVLSVIDADHLAARETVAGMIAEHVLDKATGLPSKTVMQIGPQKIQMERVFVQGSL